MAQAVSRRPVTAEALVRSRVSPCGICGEQNGTGTGFSPRTSVFPCQFHTTGAPLQVKTKKRIFFITGLHNKPQGCGTSVASAAGPFKKEVNKKLNGTIVGIRIKDNSSNTGILYWSHGLQGSSRPNTDG
jgi:hypothetical protein